ncbi:MAG: hypothetical protein KGZ60_09080 [Truepera sp.]|nr:hypothetical protein [Truepera sp.]
MLRAGLILFLALLAQAQALTILAPPDRLAAPGEFVTLVFRLEAADPLTVEVSAESASGWRILRQPGTVQLAPGRSAPVAVTVEVPADALAFISETLTLTVLTPTERRQSAVALTVSELLDLQLDAPREVTLTPDGFTVVVTNRGNNPDRAELRLLRGTELLARHALSLAPGERREKSLTVPADGFYTLELTNERGVELRRTVNVIRFGAPPPEPLRLSAELTAGLELNGGWGAGLSLEGPLSDFSTLEAKLAMPGWQRSFAEVALNGLSLRLGGGWRDPFRLNLPTDFGVAGSWQQEGWGVAAALGGIGEERFAAAIAGALTPPGYSVAAALGLSAGLPLARLRAELLAGSLTAELDYRQGAFGVAVAGEADGLPGHLRAGLEAQGLGQRAARLTARADYRQGELTVYGDATVPLAPEARLGGRIGLSAALSGPLRLSAQLGAESFVRLAYQAQVAGGWHALAFGLRHNAVGLGLELDGSWTRSAEDHLNLRARLTYYPGVARLDGNVGLLYQLTLSPVTLALSGGWNIGEQALGAGAALSYRQGPWRVGLSASLAYSYAPALADRWSLGLRLSGGYAFAVEVPPALVTAAGGRRLGVLDGLVQVGDRPLPGVIVTLGRYRLASDAAGRFRAELPPGRYHLAVELATLPIAYRLLEPSLEVEIEVQAVTTVTLTAVATTALSGLVLEDRDGDGLPDQPLRGVAARLLLTDAEGLRRLVATDETGSFQVRGLLPGPVAVRLVELPLGATVVGEAQQTWQLQPGLPTEVTFLVQPVRPQPFVPRALRIRSIAVEAERLPPGAAPLVQVVVQGEADSVQVVTPDATHDLEPIEQGIWSGRVVVPLIAAPGVYGFTVVVRAGEAEATRRGQLVIDAAAPVLELTSDAPVRPGGVLTVSVVTYFEASAVSFTQPFGTAVSLVEETPGRWAGTLAIPNDAADAVYTLSVQAVTADGRVYQQELRFRVLAP